MRPVLLLCLAVSCAPRPGAGEFISARVSWEPDVTARCFVVRATADGHPPRTTRPMPRGADDQPLQIAIYRDDSPPEVTLEALGYADEGCVEPTGEQSEPTPAAFVKRLADTGVELKVRVIGMDVDGDGAPTPADCDDGNARVRPGLPEACGDTFDNDCDGALDCVDPDCPGKSCGVGLACAGTRCVEAACGNNIDDDTDLLIDCADPDCDLQSCGVGGTCHTDADGGCL